MILLVFFKKMARKKPLSDREKMVCQRLLESRLGLGVSRARFAATAGVDVNVLASYELGRTPVRYRVVEQLYLFWPISPEWIATGEGFSTPHNLLPELESIGITGNPLFTFVYDNYIAQKVEQYYRETKDIESFVSLMDLGPKVKERAHALLSDQIKKWLDALPASDIKPFLLGLDSFRKKFFDSHRDKRSELPSLLDMDFTETDKALSNSPPDDSKQSKGSQKLAEKCKYGIDTPNTSDTISPMSANTISLWDTLKSRLQPLLSPYGSQAALARELKVSRQAVKEWMLGHCSPNAETTLWLLQWVEQQEAKQKRSGSVGAQPELKTRQENYEKHSKSNPDEK